MARVHLARLGAVTPEVLSGVAQAVEQYLGCDMEVGRDILDPAYALDPSRGQYNSTEILRRLEAELR